MRALTEDERFRLRVVALHSRQDYLEAAVERLIAARAAEAWAECLAAVTAGVVNAKKAHAERGHRQIVSALVGLEQAIPRTENPYRGLALAEALTERDAEHEGGA